MQIVRRRSIDDSGKVENFTHATRIFLLLFISLYVHVDLARQTEISWLEQRDLRACDLKILKN